MWIARDAFGELTIFNHIDFDGFNLYSSVRWEDDEPTEIILK